MSVVRVLVVEDSLTVRGHIVEVLSSTPGFEVVAEMGDGKTAIELCERLRPDVITMDMMLPVMTGLVATEYIMAYCPTPILIVSASTNRGELFKTYDAIAAGAVDVLDKPRGTEAIGVWGRRLVDTLRIVAKIRVITHPRAKPGGAPAPTRLPSRPARAEPPRLVAIGASTGGPGAVLSILRALPADFPAPLLLVIHISEPFGLALAQWLDSQCSLSVRYARDGERLPDCGEALVLMAPPGFHLELTGSRLVLGRGAERHSCRPSVDVLFESVAQSVGPAGLACLLTGMGRDGAEGMQRIRQAGGLTVAQDESTSVVFGMPGAAVSLGAAHHVLPVDEIGPFLLRTCRPLASGGANG